jgi:hypothetical protein
MEKTREYSPVMGTAGGQTKGRFLGIGTVPKTFVFV